MFFNGNRLTRQRAILDSLAGGWVYAGTGMDSPARQRAGLWPSLSAQLALQTSRCCHGTDIGTDNEKIWKHNAPVAAVGGTMLHIACWGIKFIISYRVLQPPQDILLARRMVTTNSRCRSGNLVRHRYFSTVNQVLKSVNSCRSYSNNKYKGQAFIGYGFWDAHLISVDLSGHLTRCRGIRPYLAGDWRQSICTGSVNRLRSDESNRLMTCLQLFTLARSSGLDSRPLERKLFFTVQCVQKKRPMLFLV